MPMPHSAPFTVRGEQFKSQAALERAIKNRLDGMPCNRIIVDPFLAAVVNAFHPAVIRSDQCATGEFEYLDFPEQQRRRMDTALRYRGGRVMMARFLPCDAWHDVTVYPWRKSRDPRATIKRALREKIAYVLPHPRVTDTCAEDGCEASGGDLEYEHVDPTFNEIAEACLAEMTDSEIESEFGYDKFTPGRDHLVHCISDNHPAVRKLLELHLANDWKWLCAFHHRGVQATAGGHLVLKV